MNDTTIFDFNLNNFFRYSILVLLFINIFLYTKSYSLFKKVIAFKTIYIYIALSLLLNLITLVFSYYRYDNLYLSHFYFVFQFILLSIFYIVLFKSNNQRRLVQVLFITIISILGIQYALDYTKFFKYSLLEILLTSFPITIYSIIHLYNSLTRKGVYLYFNAAILIYLTATTLIFILGNYISGINPNLARNIWFIHKLLYLVFLTLTLLEWKYSFSPYKIKAKS